MRDAGFQFAKLLEQAGEVGGRVAALDGLAAIGQGRDLIDERQTGQGGGDALEELVCQSGVGRVDAGLALETQLEELKIGLALRFAQLDDSFPVAGFGAVVPVIGFAPSAPAAGNRSPFAAFCSL